MAFYGITERPSEAAEDKVFRREVAKFCASSEDSAVKHNTAGDLCLALQPQSSNHWMTLHFSALNQVLYSNILYKKKKTVVPY